jgi:transcriptional regulator with AAA-type ATPase domain
MKDALPSNTKATPSKPVGERRSPADCPYLFFVFLADTPLTESGRHALVDLDSIIIGLGARGFQRNVINGQRCLRLTIPDPFMSSCHARLVRNLDHWLLEDCGSRNGTFVNGEPAPVASDISAGRCLFDGDLVELGHSFFLFRKAAPLLSEPSLGEPILDKLAARSGSDDLPPLGLQTLDPHLTLTFDDLELIAASKAPVLIQGESGTGKELIANALHDRSGRKGRLVPVNCGALPESLVESELFGHIKGAFTGAIKERSGFIRKSSGGTLFLDEIGDLPWSVQVALLRVLQECEVVPVGSETSSPVDLRLCSATHRDIKALVARGVFREDLMARITCFTLSLPPLRERRQDFGIIVGNLLRRLRGREAENVRFDKRAVRALLTYEWPLNIRELEKCLERAVLLAGQAPIQTEHLFQQPITCPTDPPASSSAMPPPSSGEPAPAERPSREKLEELLVAHHGNISAIARALGKKRVQIRRWLKYYQLDAKKYDAADRHADTP